MASSLIRRAEVVAEDSEVAGRFRDYLEGLHYVVRIQRAGAPAKASNVDLVVYHVPPAMMDAERRQTVRPRRAGLYRARSWLEAVHEISRRSPDAQILVAVAPGEDSADRALDSGATDVIEQTVTPGIFRRRIEMLDAFRHRQAPRASPAVDPVPTRTMPSREHHAVLELPLPELRNARYGRIDAQAVADYLGIPLKRLAAAVGMKYAGLHKTPDSPRAQEALRPIVRVLELANRAFGGGDRVRRWLNRPLHELEDDAPLAVMLAGEADAVETLLENALNGIPT